MLTALAKRHHPPTGATPAPRRSTRDRARHRTPEEPGGGPRRPGAAHAASRCARQCGGPITALTPAGARRADEATGPRPNRRSSDNSRLDTTMLDPEATRVWARIGFPDRLSRRAATPTSTGPIDRRLTCRGRDGSSDALIGPRREPRRAISIRRHRREQPRPVSSAWLLKRWKNARECRGRSPVARAGGRLARLRTAVTHLPRSEWRRGLCIISGADLGTSAVHGRARHWCLGTNDRPRVARLHARITPHRRPVACWNDSVGARPDQLPKKPKRTPERDEE